MAGVTVFRSMAEAVRAGYQQHQNIDIGYLVRTRTTRGWALAIVDMTTRPLR